MNTPQDPNGPVGPASPGQGNGPFPPGQGQVPPGHPGAPGFRPGPGQLPVPPYAPGPVPPGAGQRPQPRNPLQPGNLPRNPARPREVPLGGAWSEVGQPPPTRALPQVPPGPPLRPAAPPPARRTTGGVIAGRIIAGVLSITLLAALGLYWGVISQANTNTADSKGVVNAGETGVTFRGGANILLVGTDARTDQDGNPLNAEQLAQVSTDANDGLNTDTIMIVHIPEGGGAATAVSIPRDTWISESITSTIDGPYDDGTFGPYKPNKINSFYGAAKFYTEVALAAQGVPDSPARQVESNEAGRTMLIKVVQALTGVKIDNYAEVNLIGFYELSVALGGVPVCLNAAVNDPWSGANLPAGQQEISGSDAMAFVRQRHGLPQGDLDRVRRQQAFLSGATQKLLSAGTLTNPVRLGELVTAAGKSLTLDEGFDLLSFAGQLSGLAGGNVVFLTLPTTGPEPSTTADALATDPAQIRQFFLDITGGETAESSAPSAATVGPADITVNVLDGTAAASSGTPVIDLLAAQGFVRGQNGDAEGITSQTEHTTTLIRYLTGERASAELVATALGFGELTEDATVPSGQVEILVGTDSTLGAGLRRADPAFAGSLMLAAVAPEGDLNAGGVACVN